MPVIDIDALTLDDVKAGALAGRPVTVLGLARSGIALARFLQKQLGCALVASAGQGPGGTDIFHYSTKAQMTPGVEGAAGSKLAALPVRPWYTHKRGLCFADILRTARRAMVRVDILDLPHDIKYLHKPSPSADFAPSPQLREAA